MFRVNESPGRLTRSQRGRRGWTSDRPESPEGPMGDGMGGWGVGGGGCSFGLSVSFFSGCLSKCHAGACRAWCLHLPPCPHPTPPHPTLGLSVTLRPECRLTEPLKWDGTPLLVHLQSQDH